MHCRVYRSLISGGFKCFPSQRLNIQPVHTHYTRLIVMLVEINCKPSCSYSSVYLYRVTSVIYKSFKIHALPVNYTSSTVQSYRDRKKVLYR